jgi:hypothetical protein
MNGAPTGHYTPYTFEVWGTPAFTVPSADEVGPTGHGFTKWDNGETLTTIMIKCDGTYTAQYDELSQEERDNLAHSVTQADIDRAHGEDVPSSAGEADAQRNTGFDESGPGGPPETSGDEGSGSPDGSSPDDQGDGNQPDDKKREGDSWH